MSKKWLVDLNLNGNELQNVVAQNLASAPENPQNGMFYYNTTDNKFCLYENGAWSKYATLAQLADKQDTLVSGTNIKSVNGTSLLGEGDLSTYPAQSGNSGKFLTTNGSAVSWATVDALPSQTSQSGKFLTTNGTTASWADAPVASVNGATGAVTVSTIQNQADNTQMLKLWVGSKTDYDLIVTKDPDTLYYVQKEGEAIDIYEELDKKLDKLTTKPTAGTYTKVTINGEGQVTAGASLQASDIPELASNKVTAMTGYEKASTASAISTSDSLNTAVGKLEKALDNKVDANSAITGATKCKITYDSKGLVTAGADLADTDIPSLSLSKISDVTASAAELNIMDGVTVTTADINSVTSKIGLSDLSIDSGSTNYLEYSNSTGKFGAKVDTTVTADSTNLVTSGAVKTAINAAITGGVHYAGTWDITSATDFSGITLPQTKGALFYVTGTGPKTIGSIEWNAGDYLLFNADVAAGGTVTGKVDKIDNTESADIVRLTATQTLTNKTIDADDNTISDLTTSNFKSGTVVTTIGPASGTGAATDTELATAKSIRTALDTKQALVASATANDLATLDSNGQVVDSGKAFTTSVDTVSNASDAKIPTELAVRTAINSAASAARFTVTNPALTPVSGVATWEITNTLGTADVDIVIRETSTGEEVICDVAYGANTITVKMNATSSVASGSYTAYVHR